MYESILTLTHCLLLQAMFIISFVVRAYYWDITQSGNAEAVQSSKIEDTFLSIYHGDLPEPHKWFEWQLRLYWISSVSVLWFYGMRLHHQANKQVQTQSTVCL